MIPLVTLADWCTQIPESMVNCGQQLIVRQRLSSANTANRSTGTSSLSLKKLSPSSPGKPGLHPGLLTSPRHRPHRMQRQQRSRRVIQKKHPQLRTTAPRATLCRLTDHRYKFAASSSSRTPLLSLDIGMIIFVANGGEDEVANYIVD